jgi:hypothetical protein
MEPKTVEGLEKIYERQILDDLKVLGIQVGLPVVL